MADTDPVQEAATNAIEDQSGLDDSLQYSQGPSAGALGTDDPEHQKRVAQVRARVEARMADQQSAYKDIQSALSTATKNLQQMQFGPSQDEVKLRLGAAYADNHGMGNAAASGPGISNTAAEMLKERRLGELQRQQLLMSYPIQSAQARLQAANSGITQGLNQQRVEQQGATPYVQRNTRQQQVTLTKGNSFVDPQDPSKGIRMVPGAFDTNAVQQMEKLYGKVVPVPQKDGTVAFVPANTLAGLQNQRPPTGSAPLPTPQGAPAPQGAATPPPLPPQTAPAPPQGAPQAANGAQQAGAPPSPLPAAVAHAKAQAAAASAPPRPVSAAPTGLPDKPTDDTYYADMFTPTAMLPGGYAALNPKTQPIYASVAAEAFQPARFAPYTWNPTGGTGYGPNLIDKASAADWKAEVLAKQKDLQDRATSGRQTIYNYGHMISAMNDLNAQGEEIRTGGSGKAISALQNALRQILPEEVQNTVFSDPDLKKLATEQSVDKYALQAATLGLKGIYGARITNMDVAQQLKSLPSRELIPAVAKELARAQLDVAQDNINRESVFGKYQALHGDPTKYESFYNANFNPFSYSRLHQQVSPVLQQQFDAQNAPRYADDEAARKAGVAKGQHYIVGNQIKAMN